MKALKLAPKGSSSDNLLMPLLASDAAADPAGPTLTQALREQLGLKLEAVNADIRILVIDHIERPSGKLVFGGCESQALEQLFELPDAVASTSPPS